MQSIPASARAREAAVMTHGRREPQSSITLGKLKSQRGDVKQQQVTRAHRHACAPAVHFDFALWKVMQAKAGKQCGLRVTS